MLSSDLMRSLIRWDHSSLIHAPAPPCPHTPARTRCARMREAWSPLVRAPTREPAQARARSFLEIQAVLHQNAYAYHLMLSLIRGSAHAQAHGVSWGASHCKSASGGRWGDADRMWDEWAGV